jgi:hypothetical protein
MNGATGRSYRSRGRWLNSITIEHFWIKRHSKNDLDNNGGKKDEVFFEKAVKRLNG